MTYNPHVVWCHHRNIAEGLHDEDQPYCHRPVGPAIEIDPDAGYDRQAVFVYATRKAHPEALAPGVIPGRSAFDGIQLNVEQLNAVSGWDPTIEMRLSSGTARSLAAALIRAADIEQGLTL